MTNIPQKRYLKRIIWSILQTTLNATQNDTAVEDSDDTGNLVIDEGKVCWKLLEFPAEKFHVRQSKTRNFTISRNYYRYSTYCMKDSTEKSIIFFFSISLYMILPPAMFLPNYPRKMFLSRIIPKFARKCVRHSVRLCQLITNK